MIDIIFNITVVLFMSFVGLGIGSSSLAISSFFVAIHDGGIDQSERRMLGMIYIALRIAMVGILITTVLLELLRSEFFGITVMYLGVLLFMLYGNAIAMTKHWISAKFGPAIQAGTWYTLGFLTTIYAFNLYSVTPLNFVILYGCDVLLFMVIVNGYLRYQNRKTQPVKTS